MTYPTDLPLPTLKRLVLDALSPAQPLGQAQVDALSQRDWKQVMHTVAQHRIGPLLGWQMQHHHADVTLPKPIRDELAQQWQRSTLRNLAMQRDLLLVHRLLDEAGIAHRVMKGPFLAHRCYPHPGLRPMRDLDFLVPPDQALDAFEVLLRGGLQRHETYQGMPQAVLASQSSHHLPPLKSTSGVCVIEVHPRVLHHDMLGQPVEQDVSAMPGYWQRTGPLALGVVPCEGPTDLLLHLLIHAVYDHQFNNGPLFLADVALLVQHHPIDWALFWRLARQLGVEPGFALGLALVRRFWPSLDAGAQTHTVSPGVIDAACELMLQEMDTRGDIAKFAQDGVARSGWRYVLSRPFPSKVQLAAHYGGDARAWGGREVCFRYADHWKRLLVQTLPRIWTSRRSIGFAGDVENLQRVNRWLTSP